MHRLGHVGRSEIDHDPPWRSCLGDAEPFVLAKFESLLRDRSSLQFEIDKAGAGHSGRFAPLADIELSNDFFGDSFRILTALFGQNERGIGLIITETRIRCRG